MRRALPAERDPGVQPKKVAREELHFARDESAADEMKHSSVWGLAKELHFATEQPEAPMRAQVMHTRRNEGRF